MDLVPIYATVAWLRYYLSNSTLLSPMYLTVASPSEGEHQTVGKAFLNILIPQFHLKAMSAQETQANIAFAWNILKYTVSKECVEKFHKESVFYLQTHVLFAAHLVASYFLSGWWNFNVRQPHSVLNCTNKKTNLHRAENFSKWPFKSGWQNNLAWVDSCNNYTRTGCLDEGTGRARRVSGQRIINEMKKGSLSNFLMISSCKNLSFFLRNTYGKETNVTRKQRKNKIGHTTTVVWLRSPIQVCGHKWSTKKKDHIYWF